MSQSTEVLMPLMGEGVNEATIIKWFKKPGDKIEKNEPLLEVSTDKVDTEIPAPVGGYLIAIFSDEGSTIEVYQTIAQISEDAGAKPIVPSATVKKSDSSSSDADSGNSGRRSRRKSSGNQPSVSVMMAGGQALQSQIPGSYSGSVRSSPLVRKMAKESGIDLRMITGTGLHGRITKTDIEDFLNGGGTRVPSMGGFGQNIAPEFDPKGSLFSVSTKGEGENETLDGVSVRREKMSKIRWLTADHMLRSVRTSPHVTTTFEMDLHKVVSHREANKAKFKEEGLKLTFTAYFIEAAIHAIKKFPEVNASIDKDDILYKADINIGCAVAIESGLIVPVMKKTNDFTLRECAKSLDDIASRARNKKLKPDDIKGGTFSITNPGIYGSIHSQPIINQPQVAIMSIGAIIKRPVVVNDDITIRPLCQIGLTFDHRVVDGEGGAKFLAEMRNFLETYSDS